MMKTAKDLTGQPFGYWTVKAFAGKRGKVPYWRCECQCGTIKEVSQWNLTSDKTTSCGCYLKELLFNDLTGAKFDRWTVERYDGKHANGTHSVYLCRCSCGNRKVVMAQSLVKGASRSCGCLHRETVSSDIGEQKFGWLRPVSVIGKTKAGKLRWRCACDCGRYKVVTAGHLIQGNVTSCGCKVRTCGGLSQTKEMRAFYSLIRRDRERVLDVLWTREMHEALCELQPACVLCDSTTKLTVDHVRPLSLGFGLEPGNAVRLCGLCNSRKIDKHPDDLSATDRETLLAAAAEFADHWASKALLEV